MPHILEKFIVYLGEKNVQRVVSSVILSSWNIHVLEKRWRWRWRWKATSVDIIYSVNSSSWQDRWVRCSLFLSKEGDQNMHFGIWFILSWRQLRINRCRNKLSWSFPYLTRSRNSWEMRTTINPISREILWAWRQHQDEATQIVLLK